MLILIFFIGLIPVIWGLWYVSKIAFNFLGRNPIIHVISKIFYFFFGGIINFFSSSTGGMKKSIESGCNSLTDFLDRFGRGFSGAIHSISTFLESILNWIKVKFIDFSKFGIQISQETSSTYDSVKNEVENAYNSFVYTVTNIWYNFTDFISTLWGIFNEFTGIFGYFFESSGEDDSDCLNIFTKSINVLLDTIIPFFDKLFGKLTSSLADAFSTIADKIKDIFSDVIDGITDIF